MGEISYPPPALSYNTLVVTPDAGYMPNAQELAAYHNSNSGIAVRDKLVVDLPGSGSTCGYSHLMYTAQNLGFETICVNYSNNTEQEIICNNGGSPDTQCFYAISQAKWDATGNCLQREITYPHCGYDPYMQSQYFNQYPDSVVHRVITMLQYLVANDSHANWADYLTSNGTAPNWSKIIVGGFSQGGDMATYGAGYLVANGTPMVRAINLSAPPQAIQVPPGSGPFVAAAYLAGPPVWLPPTTTLPTVYGLVSGNDSHYTQPGTNGVYQAVWTAMGFTAANNDAEWDVNCNVDPSKTWCYSQAPRGLNCVGTPSHNLVNFAAVSPQGGHDDPLAIWNEDIYEFMLID